MKNLKELEKHLNIEFKDKTLLQTAMTHRSYINEANGEANEHNERLEFLGDAVLEILVSEYLFITYPQYREGDLTALRSAVVKMESLAKISEDLGLGEYIIMSKGEEQTGGRNRPYILANTFEAFLGALFLDRGIEECKAFLSRVLFDKIGEVIKQKSYIDSKSYLQECTQEKYRVIPVYKLVKEEGPDHDRTFTVEVLVDNKVFGKGTGKSKQQAQQEAALQAIKEHF